MQHKYTAPSSKNTKRRAAQIHSAVLHKYTALCSTPAAPSLHVSRCQGNWSGQWLFSSTLQDCVAARRSRAGVVSRPVLTLSVLWRAVVAAWARPVRLKSSEEQLLWGRHWSRDWRRVRWPGRQCGGRGSGRGHGGNGPQQGGPSAGGMTHLCAVL